MATPFTNFVKNDVYSDITVLLDSIGKDKNYAVAKTMPKGKPGKGDRSTREFRMQLVVKTNDTSEKFIPHLKAKLSADSDVSDVKFNEISPNSSKFPSYTFKYKGVKVDAVIARGANKGENFETQTVTHLGRYFLGSSDKAFAELVKQMEDENHEFANAEVVKVQQRTGSTRKTGIAIENLNAVIGDIVLTDSTSKKWYISLKDTNGAVVSAWPGGGSIFNSRGDLVEDSEGSDFLLSFGLDLNKVQDGFDTRNNIKVNRSSLKVGTFNESKVRSIFERVWGMNYFYVRRKTNGWKVFWLDREKLNSLTRNIVVTRIDYPGRASKSIRIHCKNASQQYLIEIRNSKGGEYPNDIKFRVVP